MITPINIYSWDDIQTEVCDLIECKYGKCADGTLQENTYNQANP